MKSNSLSVGIIFGHFSSSVPHTWTFLSSHMHITHWTPNVIAHTNKQTHTNGGKSWKEIYPLSHTNTHNNIIKRVGGMPWEPTGVCLWGRRGQVWGHTSSVSAERRVDHTNSIMATNTAMMRPQISTTKMPPMFSMPRPESGPQEMNITTQMHKHTLKGHFTCENIYKMSSVVLEELW